MEKLKRTNIYITKKQHEHFSKKSKKYNIKFSEIIRRELDKAMDKENE